MFINTEPPNPQVSFCIRFLFWESIDNPSPQNKPASRLLEKINMRGTQVNLPEVRLEFRGSVNHGSPYIYSLSTEILLLYYRGDRYRKESEFSTIIDHYRVCLASGCVMWSIIKGKAPLWVMGDP